MIHLDGDLKIVLANTSCALVKAAVPKEQIKQMMYDGSLPMLLLSRISMSMRDIDEIQVVGAKDLIAYDGWQELLFTCLTNCMAVKTVALDEAAYTAEDVRSALDHLLVQFAEVYPLRQMSILVLDPALIPHTL